MNRIFWVAWREFCAVVFTKVFVISLVLPPLMGVLVSYIMIAAQTSGGPAITGRVVVIDDTGAVLPHVAERLRPETVDPEVAKVQRQITEATERSGLPKTVTGPAAERAAQAVQQAVSPRGLLNVVAPEAGQTRAALVKQMEVQRAEEGKDPSKEQRADRLVAIVEVPRAAVNPSESGEYAHHVVTGYKGLDIQVQQRIARAAGAAIVDARVALDQRLKGTGLDRRSLTRLMDPPSADTKDVDESGEVKDSSARLDQIIPIVFMILLFISVMISGQSLMTAVVEEKSSRVMELLLSAVSPVQLMAGKIIGQMLVGLLMLLVYGSAGMTVLSVFALLGAIPVGKLALLLVYYCISYLTVASLLAAIGAAVNEMREAQSLQTPVMLILVVSFYGSFYIQRQPNSLIANIASFLPITSPFTMVSRLGGSEPIPLWHVPVSILVGIVTVLGTLWAAAKVFRVGVLMYGKPPNFITLLKWIRMA